MTNQKRMCISVLTAIFATIVAMGLLTACKKTVHTEIIALEVAPSYVVNANTDCILPIAEAVAKDGKRYLASVDVFRDGEKVDVKNNILKVDIPVESSYDATYYVEFNGVRTQKTTKLVVADTLAPSILSTSAPRVLPTGKYIDIETYYVAKDNTEIATCTYSLKHNGARIEYPRSGFFAKTGAYTFEIEVADIYENKALETVEITVADRLIEFGDAETVGKMSGHVWGALYSYPWYWKLSNTFAFHSKEQLGEIGKGMREDARGALCYDYTFQTEWTEEYADICGVLVPESYIPNYLSVIELTIYLEAAQGETAQWIVWPTDETQLRIEVPTNRWVTIEIPAAKIYETRVDFYSDNASFYSIGSAVKTKKNAENETLYELSAFYVDDLRIKTYGTDESALHLKSYEVYPNSEIDLTDFATLTGAAFSYEVSYCGVNLNVSKNKFMPVGSGTYAVKATIESGTNVGKSYSSALTVEDGYSVSVGAAKDRYQVGESVIVDASAHFNGNAVAKDVSVEVSFNGLPYACSKVFYATSAGEYTVKASFSEGGRTYFSVCTVMVGNRAGVLKSFKSPSEVSSTMAYLWCVNALPAMSDIWEWKDSNGERHYVYQDRAALPSAVAAGLGTDSQGAAVGTSAAFPNTYSPNDPASPYHDIGGLMLNFKDVPEYDYLVIRAYLDGSNARWVLWSNDGAGDVVIDIDGIVSRQWIDIRLSREQVESLHFTGSWYGIGTPRNCDAVYIDEIRTYKNLEPADAVFTIGSHVRMPYASEIDLSNYLYLKDGGATYEVSKDGKSVPLSNHRFKAVAGTYDITVTSTRDCVYHFSFQKTLVVTTFVPEGTEPYTVEHWMADGKGGYTLYRSDAFLGSIGETAEATPLDIESYDYEPNNLDNLISAVLRGDGDVVLQLHYSEKVFAVTVVNTETGMETVQRFKVGTTASSLQHEPTVGKLFYAFYADVDMTEQIDPRMLKADATVYAAYVDGVAQKDGMVLTRFDAAEKVVSANIDTFAWGFSWNFGERISVKADQLFVDKTSMDPTVAEGLSADAEGALHIIQDTNIGDVPDANGAMYGFTRSIFMPADLVSAPPKGYADLVIRVYVKAVSSTTAMWNYWSTSFDTTQTPRQELNDGWHTLVIPAEALDAMVSLDVGGNPTGRTVCLGYFRNCADVYIDYVGYSTTAENKI